MRGSWLLLLTLHGVVDQVDAGWALVEWEREAFSWVPADSLPAEVGEGDHVVLRRHRGGTPIELPEELAPRGGRAVPATLHPCPGHDPARRER